MKLIPNIIRKVLPVSQRAHQEALAKAAQAHANDSAYLAGQLKQVTAANIRLERKLTETEQDF